MTPYLRNKIDRYFEAQLSQEEERELLKTIIPLEGTDPQIDEALAVMLASRFHAKAKVRKNRNSRFMTGIAASVAVVLALGILIHQYARQKDSSMFAYVGGVKTENPHEIMKIIDTQLNDIGESSDLFSRTISTDLDDIREALTADDI